MKKTNMILDNAEFFTSEPQELMDFFQEREESAVWYSDETNCRADDIRFKPIFDEPICVPAEVSKLKAAKTVKFDSSEEAYADTMYAPDFGYYGSTQMMFVGGHLYPVGISAIKGMTERAGIKVEGWDKLRKANPSDLSDVLGKFMKATDGYLTVLVEDEKVRAVNSGRYVEIKTERYEYDNFFKLMYVSGATALQTRALWDDLHQEGLWKKIKKILKPDGTVIIFPSGQNTLNVEKNHQFPLRALHNWHKASNLKEADEIEKILVFSLFAPCEKARRPLPQELMYPAEYKNIGKENGKMPVILCKRLIEAYTLPGQRILEINMTDDAFLKRVRGPVVILPELSANNIDKLDNI